MVYNYGSAWCVRFALLSAVLLIAAAATFMLGGSPWVFIPAFSISMAASGAGMGAMLASDPPPFYRAPDLLAQMNAWEEARARADRLGTPES